MIHSRINILSLAEYGKIEEWDHFVHKQKHGWITSLSSWAGVLEKSFTHIKNKSIVIIGNGANKIIGLLPLYLVDSPVTGRRLVSTPFATLGNPLFSDEIGIGAIMPYLEKSLQAYRASYIEIRVSSPGLSNILANHFTIDNIFKCHYLDLLRPLEDIYSCLHRSYIRRYVNRAKDAGVLFRIADTMADIKSFFYLYSITRKRLLLPAIPLSFFTSIWEAYMQQKNAVFLIAEKSGKPAAALMLLAYGNRVSAEALGWDLQFTKDHIVAGLYWEAIKYAHLQGYSIFDFGRTDPKNTNLMEYKKR
ncbi:MAG: GNAT family N-acetyltransferase, partial [Clostridiaceae bacterium]|nr:GNAT family N-acetyltransferase [Clostridiaceae bacterium]